MTSGPFRFIRHPVYTAQMMLTLGWSLAVGGWPTGACAVALTFVLAFKARGEERRLSKAFSEYGDYRAATRRFIPFIY